MTDTTALDRLAGWISPAWGMRRLRARIALARYYDATSPGRSRRLNRGTAGPNRTVEHSAAYLREQARDLERNHDLARGVLSALVRFTVGPRGIQVEPMPRTRDGDVHDDFAEELRRLYEDWSVRPEVTWRHSWPAAQRLLARSWFRDGDVFGQMLPGTNRRLDHGTEVPFSIEMLESDMVPHEFSRQGDNIIQGVELNQWGRPRGYYTHKVHPGEFRGSPSVSDLKRIPGERMLHLANLDRISQVRGISSFASVLLRLENLGDYETSEQVAAKVAASMAAFIQKGTHDDYLPPAKDGSGRPLREMNFEPGMIFDDLFPGETIGTIDTQRPNTSLQEHRIGQLNAAAAGVDVGASTLSRSYTGSYSAERQATVEQWPAYEILGWTFTDRIVRPVYEQVVNVAQVSGAVRVPSDVDPASVTEASYTQVPMPWIDMEREAKAFEILIALGVVSEIEVIRRRGFSPRIVADQRARWQRMLRDAGVEVGALGSAEESEDLSDAENVVAISR